MINGTWTQREAIALATIVELVAPICGCHVALTGGLLYKLGNRKDCDLLFYRIRQVKRIDMDKLWEQLGAVGLVKKSGFGWCYKAEFMGLPVDCFFPEEEEGEYKPETISGDMT
jgi:hypothetical protein